MIKKKTTPNGTANAHDLRGKLIELDHDELEWIHGGDDLTLGDVLDPLKLIFDTAVDKVEAYPALAGRTRALGTTPDQRLA